MKKIFIKRDQSLNISPHLKGLIIDSQPKILGFKKKKQFFLTKSSPIFQSSPIKKIFDQKFDH